MSISPPRPPAEDLPSSGRKPTLAALREEVARLRADLDPDSSTFNTAVLLLAARAMGQNVDQLAQFLRCPRDFVAHCARRLVDNGVWVGGTTNSCWEDPQGGRIAFWSDVGVAQGKLYRRAGEDGTLQWAPVGNWWKSYDFVPPRTPGGQSVLYHPRCHPVPADAPAAREPQRAAEGSGSPRAAGPPAAPALSRTGVSRPAERPGLRVVGGADLFANATWLT